jgi:hypothetical protein
MALSRLAGKGVRRFSILNDYSKDMRKTLAMAGAYSSFDLLTLLPKIAEIDPIKI